MTLSPKYRNLLRVGVGITLAFIYIPLLVIAIYAFNGGTTLKWPLDSVTTHWFGDAIHDHARAHGLPHLDQGRHRRDRRSPSSSARSPPSRSPATASSAGRPSRSWW